MDWLGERLSHANPTLDYQDLLNHGDNFKKLLDLEIAKHSQNIEGLPCEWCEQEHTLSPFNNGKGEIVISCSGNRRVVNPDELKIWRIETPTLLSLFQKALGIQSPKITENIDGLLWDFGYQNVNGADYHLFFCRNINEVEKPKLSIITDLPHSVVFYTGTPQVALPVKVLRVPIMSLIQKITNKGLALNKEMLEQSFPQNAYATKDGAIELDDDIVLQENRLLFEPHRAGAYKKQSAKLPPLACSIIQHLYDIRQYSPPSKTLPELEASLGNKKRVISKEIKRVQDLCKKHRLKPILHKYAGDKWGINPQLKCCK